MQRLRRRYAAELPLLPPARRRAQTIAALIDALRGDGRDLAQALRIVRQLVLERLAVAGLRAAAPLQAVTGAVTALAEFALDVAWPPARAELDARHGAPLTRRRRGATTSGSSAWASSARASSTCRATST